MEDSKSAAPPKPKMGWFQPLLWGLLLVCWSSYNIHHGVESFGRWIWNLVLLLIAALNLLLSATLFFGKEWVDPATVAKRIAAQQKTLFGPIHVYRTATSDDFQILDGAFYARKSKELESLGFKKMREVVNVTASNTWPKNHAVIRGFLDPSGTMYASIYDLRIFGFIRLLQFFGVVARTMKTVECESELSDGTFVATSNTKETNKTLAPPFIVRTQFPADTSTEDIVSAHRQVLESSLSSKPGVTPTVCRNNSEVQALQDRMQAMKSAYRLSTDFDYRAEWEKISGRSLKQIHEKTLGHFLEEIHPDNIAPGPNEVK